MSKTETAIHGRGKTTFGASNFLKQYSIIIALIILWVVFGWVTNGVFISPRNASNLLMQLSIIGVLSVGMTLLLLTSNLDLSVGSVVGMTGLIAAQLITNNNYSPLLAVTIVLLVGIGIGAWHGFLVAYRKLPSFVVTLAGLIMFRGIALVLSNSLSIPIVDKSFLFVGSGYIPIPLGYIIALAIIAIYVFWFIRNKSLAKKNTFIFLQNKNKTLPFIGGIAGIILFVVFMNLYQGIPIVSVPFIVLAAVFSLILNRTRFGKYIYAIGGNSEAARVSGINVSRNVFICFIIMGVLSSLAGLLLAARLGQTTNSAGTLFEMDTISACIIGGVSLTGGNGKIRNAVVGTLLIMSISNGMSLLNINTMAQYVVRGIVFIIAVWFDMRYRAKSRI